MVSATNSSVGGTADDGSGSGESHDAGTTLVETLIAVTIMGMVVVALLAAVQMSIRSSALAFKASEVETVLLNASDRVTRAPQMCGYRVYVEAAALSEDWPASSVSVDVERLVGETGTEADWRPEGCSSALEAFDVQRLTITATDPTGEITRTRVVVKSDVE
jgi:Tfp pilus assembly protein PilV